MDQKDVASEKTEWAKMQGSLPQPIDPAATGLVWREFCAQFQWYDHAATRNRRAYQILKFLALGAGAAVTVLAALGAPAPITASFGAAIVVIESGQQIGQFHPNWINYRTSAETMRQHGFFYAAGVAPYNDPHTRCDRLAQVMRKTITAESGTWADTVRKTIRNGEQ
ncbi:DUF4231 domain-containing protein [Arthrobacter sp. ov118]|uniref:DUF4231 domain-containing protein n=1 Tax=Arthrobacter sp. ov118 TaxID=1761747 RepID=UPI0008F27C7A|nr:DUF4231 domain-containing protein [Arthrobacter sp. ov118]SFT99077.1 Protein of unknown function [Arthrobacter sp. ov118]